jgi:Ser/Thr protein kinase RdoA (MazF antagonist)
MRDAYDVPSQAARVVAARLGSGAMPELVRSGSNHVFRAGPHLIRVGAAGADFTNQVAVARRLHDLGVPVLTPLDDAAVVCGRPVTVWEFLEHGDRIDFEQLGERIAHLHRIAPDRLRDLARLRFCGDTGWLHLDDRLEAAGRGGVAEGRALDALRAAWARLEGCAERARQGPQVLCHGDLHPGNVLMRGSEVVILDWDAIGLAAPAWDHAALIPWASRYGGAPGTYPEFARGYGADLRDDRLAQDLSRLRLLGATVNLVLMAGRDARYAAEAHARLRYWLGDPGAPTWAST